MWKCEVNFGFDHLFISYDIWNLCLKNLVQKRFERIEISKKRHHNTSKRKSFKSFASKRLKIIFKKTFIIRNSMDFLNYLISLFLFITSIIFHCLFCLKFVFTLQNHKRCFTSFFYHLKCCGIFHNLAFLCKMTATYFLIWGKTLLSAKILKTCVNNTVHRYF